jgi:hypothetical protein
MNNSKKTWGKGSLKYCPKRKIVWSISRTGNLAFHRDMPTYGLPRKEMPNG